MDTPLVDIASAQGKAQSDRLETLARSAQSAKDNKAVREAAEKFEAVFINEMLKPMFEGMEENVLFGGGPGEKIFRSMFVDEVSKEVAQKGGFGIADVVYAELIKLQEGPDAP